MKQSTTQAQGFTLVEMIVVAPIVVLAIGAFLTVIISMTGEVIASRASNALSYNVQDALNHIEQDVKLSSSFLATNNVPLTAVNAQGYNDDATAFTNIDGASGTSIILNMVATTANPLSTTSGYIYLKNKPDPCATAQNNTPFTYNVVYFIKDSTLWRRVIMPNDYTDTTNTVCAVPFQQPSCSPTYMDNNPGATFCKTNDIRLVDGVTGGNFFVQYFSGESATSVNSPASTAPNVDDRNIALQSATTVSVAIKAQKETAGRDVERTAVLRVSRLDTNASSIAVITTDGIPTAPFVKAKAAPGAKAVFEWPAVSGASGYTLQYNINGGAWQTSFTNQNTRTATITATANEDVVNVRVTATGSAGTSGYGTATITIPLWESLMTQNSWSDYAGTFASAQYTKTKAGVVIVKGLIKRSGTAGSTETIGVLPPGYRPEGGILLFGNSTDSNVTGRADVYPDGSITMNAGSAAWFSLDTIRFVPGGRYTRSAFTPVNGWTNYSAPYAPSTYVQDSAGRVSIQGLLNVGTITNGTRIFDVPAALLPSQYMHISTRSAAYGYIGIEYQAGVSGVVAKNVGSSYLSAIAMYYPATYANWTNLPLVNGWQWYGSIFSTPQYTKSTVDNVVTLKGLINNASAQAYDTVIGTLPVGSRPKDRLLMTTVSADNHARIDIMPNGNIHFMTGSNLWVSLDGLSFKAEQ